MFKKIITLVLFLIGFISFSQEIVSSFPLDFKGNRDVFQIVNDSTKVTTFFICDKEKIKAIRLNKEMQVVDSLSTNRINHEVYVGMIGNNGDDQNPNLFWSSPNRKEILVQRFNFEIHKVTTQNYVLSLKDERSLQSFSQNGRFYLLTVLKNSDKLKLYVFDANGKLEEKIIDLAGFKFYKSDYQKTTLYGFLSESLFASNSSFSLQKISSENPTSLVKSSMKRKCYLNGNTLVMTFDTNIDYTQLITLNLEAYTATEKFIKKPYLYSIDPTFLTSNSFLIDNKLYQIKSSSSQIILTLKNLDDNLLKTYAASDRTPSIDFKNTEIIQEDGNASKKRILETSAQFIRKMNNLNAGISCYKLNDNYLITLGSVSEEAPSGSAMLIGGMFGVAGVLIAAAISSPTMESFNSYANRRVVYINCLFDKEANHINGEIQPLAFDKIRIFADKNADISSQTLFKMDGSYYLGYHDKNTKEYTIRKFED
ncbi:hypothetical protein [Flavobacterium sp.]|uniref:hypothetical protein n=1 Tax=Flavobacterium sp. TaxID=239 RepID=UPI00286B2B5C|nr:hypothetical protein [Flavobacterium sp.]